MKKLLLGLGAIASVAAPVAAVVACGAKTESFADKQNDEIKKITSSDLAAADKEEMILAVQATKTQAELDKVVAGYADELKAATMKDGDAEKKVMLTDDIKEMIDYDVQDQSKKDKADAFFAKMTLPQLRSTVDHLRTELLDAFQEELHNFITANGKDDAEKARLTKIVDAATNWESLMRNIADTQDLAPLFTAEETAKAVAAAKATAGAMDILASSLSASEFAYQFDIYGSTLNKYSASDLLKIDFAQLSDPAWDDIASATYDKTTRVLTLTDTAGTTKEFKIIHK